MIRLGSRRIAVLCYHTSPLVQPGGRDAGGMNVYVRETARELAQLGYAVDVFTRATTRRAAIQEPEPGVRVIPIPAGPLKVVEKSRLPAYVTEFSDGVAAFRLRAGVRYDLVHSHYWLSGLAGLDLQRRWDVPHVTMFHTLGEVKNRARLGEREPEARIAGERRVAAGANRIVCATGHERSLLRELYHAAESRIAVAPCGVDTELFRPLDREAAKRRLELSGAPVVLYAGRIEPLKGIDIVMEAIASLDEPRPIFVVAGGDRHSTVELTRLKAIAGRLGITDRMRFVGAVAQTDLPGYYSAADVCVVPSYYESFGMVALEAQACGTPVVASRVGGLPGVVRDGETGYLVPWRCPEPFAERLDLLLQNPALRESVGAAARAWALGFRWDAIAGQLSGLYEALLTEQTLTSGCDRDARLGRQIFKSMHVRCEVA
ncbi:MAG: glycosyltransferase [Dehalococcoidia bacterium]